MDKSTQRTACFIGHREIANADKLEAALYAVVENLIVEKGVWRFLFGSKSAFNELSYAVVTRLKQRHPHIQRVYVRAEFPDIREAYTEYLMQRYEETYYPPTALRAGRAVYVKRNNEMIDNSHYCVLYYDRQYAPARKTAVSGTKRAYDYATKRHKRIINMAE